MIDKSSLALVLFSTAILLISLKDVIFTQVKQDNTEEGSGTTTKATAILADTDVKFHDSNDDETEYLNVKKEIPTLKMKHNVPTIRFSFW